jgi:arsenate reductase-like glutaredoxin family protein
LRELGAQLHERDLGKQPLNEAEIEALIGDANVVEFLNTRSASYRQQGFKNQPPTKTQAIKLMAQDANLIKRPITIKGNTKVLGFDQAQLRDLVSSP